MDQKEIEALVDRLEVYARKHPSAYKLRVGLLAALGYSFLVGTIVGVLLLIAGVVYIGAVNIVVIYFLVIPIGAAAVVLRSMFVQFAKPSGHRLRYADAPPLFDLVKRIRKATNGPKVHKLLLSGDFNASIVQRPRLGMLGWRENYLIIGLPLLHGLAPDEVRAVIAHEFGHLSRNHGAFSGWIYRVRQTWDQVGVNFRTHRRYGSVLFEWFFNWYAPYFVAYSYVLARTREYDADRSSVVLTGKQAAARYLIKLELKERGLNEEFWPEFLSRANTQPEPPADAFTEMLQ